jgi:hypothetical protein
MSAPISCPVMSIVPARYGFAAAVRRPIVLKARV